MSPPSCCFSKCCNVIYYVCVAIVFIYLILCVLLIPKYRYVALMVIGIAVLYVTSAWRLLPSERQVVWKRAELLARQRCTPPEATAVYPRYNFPTTTSFVAFHEPFTADARV